MADNTGGPDIVAAVTKLTPYLPGVAGAVLSMAFGEGLKWQGKALTFFVGLVVAFLLPPVIVEVGRAVAPVFFPPSMMALLGFTCGFFGMALFGGLYRAVGKYAGDPLKIIKIQVGPVSIGDTSGEA